MQRPKAKARMKDSERGFYHRLCREQFPGLTVAEMLARLSSVELLDWMAWTEMQDKHAKDEAARNKH